MTLWFTGLSGAGKSTLARSVQAELEKRGRTTMLLDGDEVRALSPGLGYSREDRAAQAARVAARCVDLARSEIIALASLISPYRADRDAARATIGSFMEIYVRCPLSALIQRDARGLYRRALAGEIEHFTGISDPYEPPLHPELIVETSATPPEQSAAEVIAFVLRSLDIAG